MAAKQPDLAFVTVNLQLMPKLSTSTSVPILPQGVVLLERGWLSSNNVLIGGENTCALVDSGYVTHAEQTITLVDAVLGGRRLTHLINTHLHSDHCGGNAALQAHHPALQTWIPPGQAVSVRDWDTQSLSYSPTGQQCDRFQYTAVLQPGSTIELGERYWQVHAAAGHDPDAVLLFEPTSRLLLSADALWGNGFGVVFPELDGEQGFCDVARTLDVIEQLQPLTVIPGHGPAFMDVSDALARARRRLAMFVQEPTKHARYAAKVLLKFKLLESQILTPEALQAWTRATPLLGQIHAKHAPDLAFDNWITELAQDLITSGAASRESNNLRNL